MLHLTHTGFHAGRPFCGAPRNEADTYQHPAYRNDVLAQQLAVCCPSCREEWDAAVEADAAEAASLHRVASFGE